MPMVLEQDVQQPPIGVMDHKWFGCIVYAGRQWGAKSIFFSHLHHLTSRVALNYFMTGQFSPS